MGSEGEWEDGPPDAEPVQEESEEVYEEEAEPEGEIEEIQPEEAPSPPAPSARADRSVFATLSGLGFFVVVLLLLFTVLPAGLGVLGLTILGMAIGTAIPPAQPLPIPRGPAHRRPRDRLLRPLRPRELELDSPDLDDRCRRDYGRGGRPVSFILVVGGV